jgi:hypothetical protein
MAIRTRAACYSGEGTGHYFADLLEPEPVADGPEPDAGSLAAAAETAGSPS